jgi:hypothetical protein
MARSGDPGGVRQAGSGDGTPSGTATASPTDGPEWLPEVLCRLLGSMPPWLVDAVQALFVLALAYVVSDVLAGHRPARVRRGHHAPVHEDIRAR